jgi:hypothetical protein
MQHHAMLDPNNKSNKSHEQTIELPQACRALSLSFTQKMGALAALFLVFLGGVSGYSLLDSYEIRHEIEETSHSDIPLLKITTALERQSRKYQNLIELMAHYNVHDRELAKTEIPSLAGELEEVCLAIDDLIAKGLLQSKFAADDELAKEGNIRINQSIEDYGHIQLLFESLESSHNQQMNSFSGLTGLRENRVLEEEQLHGDIGEAIATLEAEFAQTQKIIDQISEQLDRHMKFSLELAMAEQHKLQFFHFYMRVSKK